MIVSDSTMPFKVKHSRGNHYSRNTVHVNIFFVKWHGEDSSFMDDHSRDQSKKALSIMGKYGI